MAVNPAEINGLKEKGSSKKLLAVIQYLRTYPGWLMVLIGFITLMAISWPLMVYKFVYGPVIDEFGWTRTQATLLISYHWVAAAITGFFLAGPLIDRFGLRLVLIVAQIIACIGLLTFLIIQSMPVYYLAGMIIGFSAAATMISVNVFVSRWFLRNQGMAIGITIMAHSVAGAVIPLLCEPLIRLYGWRITMAIGSVFILLVAIPVFCLFAKETPSAKDLLPETTKDDEDPEMLERLKAAELDVSLSDIFKKPMFWFIVAAIFCASAVDQGLIQHTILYIERDLELGSKMAAYAMSGTFALGIFAKFFGGWLYDKISIKGIMLFYLLLAVSVGMAIPIAGPLSVALFAICRGVAHGGLIGEPPIFAKHCYGTKYLNRLLPILLGSMYAGFATGPIILSKFYDYFGSYTYGLVFFISLSILAIFLLIFVQPYYRQRLQSGRA